VNHARGLWKLDLLMVAAVVIAFGAFAGFQADRDAEITAEHVKEADERKAIKPEERMALSAPLQCDATVMHSGTPGELPRTRCYVRSDK
jgi:hypothetical protein